MEATLFYILATILVVFSILTVTAGNPVRSAVYLVSALLGMAGLFFLLKAEFVGAVQILVYVGGIMVLFLFVIMMLKVGGKQPKEDKPDLRVFPAIAVAVGLGAVVFAKVMLPLIGMPIRATDVEFGEPQQIGMALPTTYVWPFMVASVLLLIGVVGSIMLVKGRAR